MYSLSVYPKGFLADSIDQETRLRKTERGPQPVRCLGAVRGLSGAAGHDVSRPRSAGDAEHGRVLLYRSRRRQGKHGEF